MAFCYGDVVKVWRPEEGILLRYLLEDSDRIYLAVDTPRTILNPNEWMPPGFGIRIYYVHDLFMEFVGRPDYNGNIVLSDKPYEVSKDAMVQTVEHRLELVRNGIPPAQKLKEVSMLVSFLDCNGQKLPEYTARHFEELSDAFHSAGLGDFARFVEEVRQART